MINPVCSICLDPPVFGEQEISSLRCGHIFHRQPCLADWIRKNQLAPNCPQCRNPFVASQQINLAVVHGVEAPTAAELEEARRVKELQDDAEEKQAMLRDIKAGAAAHRESLRQKKAADRAAIVSCRAGQEALNNNPDLLSHLPEFRSIPVLVEDLKRVKDAVNFNDMKQELKDLFEEFFNANLPAAGAVAGAGAAARVPRPGMTRSTRRAASSVGNAGAPKRSRLDTNNRP